MIYLVMILALLSVSLPVIYAETTINIDSTHSTISEAYQHALAAELFQFARCDQWEGNNTRDCTIKINNIQDGNNGTLTIPGTMSLNITWLDH